MTRRVLVKQQIGEERDAALIREQLLLLALDWDAIDVAKEQIIKDDLDNLTVRIEHGFNDIGNDTFLRL